MTRVQGVRTSFNGGELSPLTLGRVDVAKFSNGCKRMENFLPTTQGPALARPGFRFVAEVKNSADRTWLVRFERSADQAYMLEFGHLYIRFYYGRGVLMSGATPYEIASPYSAADLTNSDGTFALRYAQTGDVIFITHPNHFPKKLVRTAPTSWAISDAQCSPPPFASINATDTTVYASAATGSIALTSSAAVFTASMVGQYVYLAEKDVRSTAQWEAGKTVIAGALRRSDGKNYEALNGATTGGVKPTHTQGAVFDGDTGVQWQFLDPGYGWAKITGFTSATSVSADVVSRIPANAVGSGNATKRWALEAWSPTDGYPEAVTFFRERLVFARGATLWFSVAGDFENFAYEIDGETSSDAAFDRLIASDRTNSIRWLSPGNVLLVGTLGDEWAIAEQTTTDAFGPSNAQTRRQSTYGSSRIAPVRIGGDTLFVQKSGRKVRAMAFRFEEDGFDSPDMTVYAEHVTRPSLVDIAFQQEPMSIMWAARSDGELVGMTFNREQDVVAWHRHPMPGAVVETVETIPSPDGSRDDLWIIARYTVDGVVRRYVAHLESEASELTDQADWFYVDQGATYSGPATEVISGLDYLEGHEVWILANGAVHPNRTVQGGQVALKQPYTKVQIGLPSPAILETTEVDHQRVGAMKRIHKIIVRVWLSLGGRAGPAGATREEMKYRPQSTPLGSAPPAHTGDVEIEWSGDYGRSLSVIIEKDKPTPVNVLAIFPPTDG